MCETSNVLAKRLQFSGYVGVYLTLCFQEFLRHTHPKLHFGSGEQWFVVSQLFHFHAKLDIYRSLAFCPTCRLWFDIHWGHKAKLKDLKFLQIKYDPVTSLPTLSLNTQVQIQSYANSTQSMYISIFVSLWLSR